MIENCIVESRDTIRANTTHIGTPENIKIVVEKTKGIHYNTHIARAAHRERRAGTGGIRRKG